MLFGKGLTLEPYFTFESNIDKILTQLENTEGKEISDNSDVTTLIDMIIKKEYVYIPYKFLGISRD